MNTYDFKRFFTPDPGEVTPLPVYHQPLPPEGTICISGLWLRRSDNDTVEVLIQTHEGWYKVVEEPLLGPFSHIIEAPGMQRVYNEIDPETHTMTRYEIPLEPSE